MHMRYKRKTEEAPGRKSSDLAWGLMGAQISLYSAPAEGVAIVASVLIVLYKMLLCFAFCLLCTAAAVDCGVSGVPRL